MAADGCTSGLQVLFGSWRLAKARAGRRAQAGGVHRGGHTWASTGPCSRQHLQACQLCIWLYCKLYAIYHKHMCSMHADRHVQCRVWPPIFLRRRADAYRCAIFGIACILPQPDQCCFMMLRACAAAQSMLELTCITPHWPPCTATAPSAQPLLTASKAATAQVQALARSQSNQLQHTCKAACKHSHAHHSHTGAGCRGSPSWCWTKPTACWTWALSRPSGRLPARRVQTARRPCSAPPGLQASTSWPRSFWPSLPGSTSAPPSCLPATASPRCAACVMAVVCCVGPRHLIWALERLVVVAIEQPCLPASLMSDLDAQDPDKCTFASRSTWRASEPLQYRSSCSSTVLYQLLTGPVLQLRVSAEHECLHLLAALHALLSLT